MKTKLNKKARRLTAIVMALAMGISLLAGISFAPITAEAGETKAIADGVSYAIGDTITISTDPTYVLRDDDYSGNYLSLKAGNYVIPTPSIDTSSSFPVEFSGFLEQNNNQPIGSLFFGYGKTFTGNETITGFKCIGGDGTQNNMYKFELLYSAPQSWDSGDTTVTYNGTDKLTVSKRTDGEATDTGAMADYSVSEEENNDAPWRSILGSVTTITFEDGVTSVGKYAFYNCIALTSLTLANTIKTIGDNAFSYCDALTGTTIPASVTEIGHNAFHTSDESNPHTFTFVKPTEESTLKFSGAPFYSISSKLAYSGDGYYVLFNGDRQLETGGSLSYEYITSNTTLTWKIPTYNITKSITGDGCGVAVKVGNDEVTEAKVGSSVTLTAKPNTGFALDGDITASVPKTITIADMAEIIGTDGITNGSAYRIFKNNDGNLVIFW